MSDEEQTEQIPGDHETTILYGNRSEFYREIMPSYFWGGVRQGYLEAIAISTRSNAIESMKSMGKQIVLENVEEICIKFTPQQAKLFAGWLLVHLKDYEDKYGTIKTDSDEDVRWINDILGNIQSKPIEE